MIRHLSLLLISGLCVAALNVSCIAGEKKTKDATKPKDPSLVLEEKGEWKKADVSYPVKLEKGKIYRIELVSDKFDAYVKLINDGKTVAEDSDSAGKLNARIFHKAMNTSDYSIVVSSKGRQAGPFTLKVTLAKDRTIASEYPNKAIDLKWADGKARYGGRLNQNDANTGGRYYKVFAVTLDQGKSYKMDHRSSDFDAYLLLEDAEGKRLAYDDDGGEGLNARLTFTPAKTSVYRVIATSLPTRVLGSFDLDIVVAEPKKKAQIDKTLSELELTQFVPFVTVLRVDSPLLR